MTIEFFTGFEGCATAEDAVAFFDAVGTYYALSATNGFNNSKAFGVSRNTQVTKNCTAAKTKVAGRHVKKGSSGTTDTGRAELVFVGPSIYIFNYNNDRLHVYQGANLLSDTEYIWAGDVFHLEVKVFSSATVGTVDVKINGSLHVSLTGVNTGGQDITGVRCGPGCTSSSITASAGYIDNFFISDDWEGELYSYLLQPNSDAEVAFTPSAGTDNYALIETDDGDTTYVSSDVLSNRDLYGYDDLPVGLIPVALLVRTTARKDGTGGRTLQQIGLQDTIEYSLGTAITLDNSYPSSLASNKGYTSPLAPDGTAWTREKVNAMQWGFKVTG